MTSHRRVPRASGSPGPDARAAGPRDVPARAALFLSLFAAQAGLLALSPLLADMAAAMGVSIAATGQLRTVSGLVAGVIALAIAASSRVVALRDLLVAGLSVLAAGCGVTAAAPGFGVLAAGQVLVGVALGLILSAGVAAASEWAPQGDQGRMLAWALVGQPAAWIVGVPLIGLVGQVSWRFGWLAVPLAASVAALVTVLRGGHRAPARSSGRSARGGVRSGTVAAWGAGELLAYAAWGGTLVYAGALFVQSYRTSLVTTGVLLGAVALAYLPGTFLARRRLAAARLIAITGAGTAAVLVATLGIVRPGVAVSAMLLAALVFVNGGRTIAGSALGLSAAAERKLPVMALRACFTQLGYLVGAAGGGLALALGGYGALGVTFAVFFLASSLVQVGIALAGRRARSG